MEKIMHLISTEVFSGAENVACQIINIFKDDRDYSDMIYVSKIGKNKKNLEDRKIPYYELSTFDYKSIKQAVNQIRPDIIHAHDIKASIMASLFFKKAKIIAHVHANHENMRKVCAKTILFNIFSKRMSKIIWVSQSALDNYVFKKNVLEKSMVLYNVINPKEIIEKIQIDKENYEEFDLIFLGRMTTQKNPLRLINIIHKVYDKNSKIKVALVGSGELDYEVQQAISQKKLENNVKFYGFKSNPYKILNNSKMMIMTSNYEGTPMCALEALSLGKPIITTPTDGLIDIIENNKSGFISNNDEDLVDKILMLINSDKIINTMSEYAKGTSDKVNNIDKYKEEIKKIYKKK